LRKEPDEHELSSSPSRDASRETEGAA